VQKERTYPGPSLWDVLRSLMRDPVNQLLRRWNWKSAVTSSLVRAAIFFFVNLTAGTDAAIAAFLTEFAFRACTAGFYGCLTQHLTRAQPHWQGLLGALVLLPFFNHTLEFLAHWWSGTEKLAASIVASVAFTVISTAFHLFVMRRGLLVTGEGSQSLGKDLAGMPRAVGLFIAAPFRWLWGRTRAR